MHFRAQSDCISAKPTYGLALENGCNNNNGNIGCSSCLADFSQIGYATWSRHCYMRIFASPPPTAPPLLPQPMLPPLPPAAPPLQPKVYAYGIVQSGTCALAGGESIPSSLAECTAAGEALSIAWTWNTEYDSPHVPSGCIVSSTNSALYFNPQSSLWPCGRQTSSTWYCVCRFDVQPPQSPPAPPALPSPPLPPPRPPLQPGSQYVRSSSEVVAALQDSSIDRIVLATGVYEFTDSMCFAAPSGIDEDFIGSALCIDRAVTIEAMEAGTVELDAKRQRRVISIGSAGVATLIGLSITGGFSTKGGGLYVDAGGVANLKHCDVHKNQANNGGGLFIVADGDASMDGSKFYENTALIANGGGLVIWGTAELRNCDIYENDAPGTFGGGLYVGGGAVAELADCRLYENTAETGGGLYNNGVLTLRTSLLERNTGPDGAQLYLAGGSELIYVLPVPPGNYLDGAFICQEQRCKADISCDTKLEACELVACPTQFCDANVLGGKYIKAYRPDEAEAINEQFPMACPPGVQGNSSDIKDQSSPFCAGSCGAGFYCPLGTWQPVPCAVGRYSRGGAKTAEECPSCPAGSVANATGMGECTQCAAGTFQEEEGEQACAACKPGSFCPEGASAPLPCKEGSYSNATNLTDAKDCTETDPGHFAPTGSTEQTPCSAGTVQPQSKHPKCDNCAAGKFMNASGGTECHACTPASYCPEGASVPLPCSEGTYSNRTHLGAAADCTGAGRLMRGRPTYIVVSLPWCGWLD